MHITSGDGGISMLEFTKEEKSVLFIILTAGICGVLICFFGNYNSKITSSEIREQIKIVNINTATVDDLVTLPGIGAGFAWRIIQYRSQNGPFHDTADLMKVKGIGKKKFERIRMFLTVEK
jgi:comEA protein